MKFLQVINKSSEFNRYYFMSLERTHVIRIFFLFQENFVTSFMSLEFCHSALDRFCGLEKDTRLCLIFLERGICFNLVDKNFLWRALWDLGWLVIKTYMLCNLNFWQFLWTKVHTEVNTFIDWQFELSRYKSKLPLPFFSCLNYQHHFFYIVDILQAVWDSSQ